VNAQVAQQNAQLQWQRHNMAMINYLEAYMESIVGLGPLSPRIHIPAVPPTGPLTLNNFKLDNAVVGAINTGTVRDIDVSLNQLHSAGLEPLRKALAELTEAVASAQGLSVDQKDTLLEQIAFLSSQVTAAAPQRKPGLIRATFDAVASTAAKINSVATAWNNCAPILRGLFGLGLGDPGPE
jgi:hypothetical protein